MPRQERSEPQRPPVVSLLLALAAAALVFSQVYHVLIPFFLSFALAYVLSPVVDRIQSRGIRRTVTVVGFYLAALGCAWLLADSVIQVGMGQLKNLELEGPSYLARTQAFLASLEARANARLPFGLQLPQHWGLGQLAASASSLPGLLLGYFPMLSLLLLVPFITFFTLVDGPDAIDGFIQLCPSRYVEQAMHLISEIDNSLGNYLRGLLVVAAAIAAASFFGLVLLGVDQALPIALLAGVTSVIPYLGAILGAVVGGLVAGFQFGTAAAGLKVVALFALIRLGDEILLQPLVARHSVQLHPLAFLATLMIGGELFGFVGLLFAVPVVCVLKALMRVAWSWYSTETRLVAPEGAVFDAAAVPYT